MKHKIFDIMPNIGTNPLFPKPLLLVFAETDCVS